MCQAARSCPLVRNTRPIPEANHAGPHTPTPARSHCNTVNIRLLQVRVGPRQRAELAKVDRWCRWCRRTPARARLPRRRARAPGPASARRPAHAVITALGAKVCVRVKLAAPLSVIHHGEREHSLWGIGHAVICAARCSSLSTVSEATVVLRQALAAARRTAPAARLSSSPPPDTPARAGAERSAGRHWALIGLLLCTVDLVFVEKNKNGP